MRYPHIAHELLLCIKRTAIRGRIALDAGPDTALNTLLATCDHVEDLADQALSLWEDEQAIDEPP